MSVSTAHAARRQAAKARTARPSAAKASTTKVNAQAVEAPPPRKSWLLGWLGTYLLTLLHIGAVATAQANLPVPAAVAIFVAPGLVTWAMRRNARRAWWRFPTAWILSQVAVAGVGLVVLLVAEAWVLHRSWVTEQGEGDHRLRDIAAAVFVRAGMTPPRLAKPTLRNRARRE